MSARNLGNSKRLLKKSSVILHSVSCYRFNEWSIVILLWLLPYGHVTTMFSLEVLLILYGSILLGATPTMTTINLLIFAWRIPWSLNRWICLSMLVLSHDIAQHVYTSEFLCFSLAFGDFSLLISDGLPLSCRYLPDDVGDMKLQINAQNCLHCKVYMLSGKPQSNFIWWLLSQVVYSLD